MDNYDGGGSLNANDYDAREDFLAMKIASRNGVTLFEDKSRSVKETLAAAIAAGADLSDADLSRANLSRANLSRANLSDADLDFSCFPLWCGSFGIKADGRLLYQLCYHICKLDSDTDDFKAVKTALTDYANKFHRVEECGRI